MSDPDPKEDKPSVWVCVPTYNEAGNIERVVRGLLEVFDKTPLEGHVLIVDDASPDGTGALADALSLSDKRVQVIHRQTKEGIGRAYVVAFREALTAGADLIVQMDCDLSHDPETVPLLVDATGGADVVLGSRYVRGGRIVNWSPLRRIISRGGCWYARVILGLAIRDLTGGFKCFRRRALETIPLEAIAAEGYCFQIEMTYRALLQGYRILELPIVFRERGEGESKMSLRIVLEAAKIVPQLRLRRDSLQPEHTGPGTRLESGSGLNAARR